jgi:hypothetical protein
MNHKKIEEEKKRILLKKWLSTSTSTKINIKDKTVDPDIDIDYFITPDKILNNTKEAHVEYLYKILRDLSSKNKIITIDKIKRYPDDLYEYELGENEIFDEKLKDKFTNFCKKYSN